MQVIVVYSNSTVPNIEEQRRLYTMYVQFFSPAMVHVLCCLLHEYETQVPTRAEIGFYLWIKLSSLTF
jgi:hypothetical protein